MDGFHIPVGNTHVFVPTAHVMADLAVADMVLAWVDANMDLPVGNAVYLVDALMGELSDEVGDLEIQVREPGRSEPKVALADTVTGERAGFVARQSFLAGVLVIANVALDLGYGARCVEAGAAELVRCAQPLTVLSPVRRGWWRRVWDHRPTRRGRTH